MITHDGGMLRRCGTESACRKIHGAATDYGHRPVGTLAAYLGVSTGQLKVVIEHWRNGAPLPVLQWVAIDEFRHAGAGI